MLVGAFWLVVFFLNRVQPISEQKKVGGSSNAADTFIVFLDVTTVLYMCHFAYFEGLSHPVAETIYAVCNLCVFPLFYLYLTRVTGDVVKTWVRWVMFAPAIVVFVAYSICFPLGLETVRQGFYVMARVCFMVGALAVWIAGSRNLTSYRRRLDDYYSDERSLLLLPLTVLLHAFGLITVVAAVLNVIGKEWFQDNPAVVVPALMMTVLLFSLGYAVLRLELVRSAVAGERDSQQQEEAQTAVAEPIDGDEVRMKALRGQLEQLMTDRQVYLDPAITIADVAAMLGSNRTYISNFINQQYGVNFSQFVNRYRVEHAKTILQSADYALGKEALLDAIYTSGFQNEQSFYRIFKQLTGTTPKEYRKAHLRASDNS